jgi:hypothetical protein
MSSLINEADFPPLCGASLAIPKKPVNKWTTPPVIVLAHDPPVEKIRPCRDLPHKNRNTYWYLMYSLDDVLYDGNPDSRIINTIKPLYKKYGPTWIWDVEGKPEDFYFAEDERYYARRRFDERNQPWFGLPPPPNCKYYWKYQQWYEEDRSEDSFSPYVATWTENGCLKDYQYFCSMNRRYGANWIWEVMWHNTDDQEFVQELRYYIEKDWILKNKKIRLIKEPSNNVDRSLKR